MNNLRKLFARLPRWVLVLVVLYVSTKLAWNHFYPSVTLRYKMTVTVETPEGDKTGSAVREVTISRFPVLLPIPVPWETAGGQSIKGEAAIVDLGQKGLLFALMRGDIGFSDYGYMVLFSAFPVDGATTARGIKFWKSLKVGTKRVLDVKQYPFFVRFKDLNDPLSVMRTGDGTLEYSYGKGFKIKEVDLEITDEPVTTGIANKLPWLRKMKGYLDGRHMSGHGGLANSLDTGDFLRGVK